MKYASPRDLPSFPSVGITNKDSSAGAAASLANAHHKTFEYWKPGESAPASKAAMLAKDYKPAPLWHPEMSAAGSKAALIAANHGGKVDIWRPGSTAEGNSAAGQAMRMKNLSPAIDYGYTAEGSSRALMAATGAMSGRMRSGSSPVVGNLYPDSANAAANALNAATVANRPSMKGANPRTAPTDLPGLSPQDATRIHDAAVTNLGREMYTSHPPVAPEVEEKNRQAGLRAAAISMAKQMYDIQQKALESSAGVQRSDSQYAATHVHKRRSSMTSSIEAPYQPTAQYANLQEAAQRLAAERLAKLHDENAAYRDYYGTDAPVQSRLSVRSRMRRRASSDGQLPDDDTERSRQIRSQMSIFNSKVAQVDAKKRQKDRDALMAAAQRNVANRMHGMDEKLFEETGKVSPAMMAEWEAKAKARAEADSGQRMVNHGKVNIGGGRYMDQSEVEAIAAARVQPTLDEITEKAEAHRARDEELRQQAEEQRQIAEEKARTERERNNKTKDEWKRFKGRYLCIQSTSSYANALTEEEKREERARKEEEKARKAEEKRLREEEKHKPKISAPIAVEPIAEPETFKEEPVETTTKATPALGAILSDAPLTILETPPITELKPETTALLPTNEPDEPIILVNPVVTPNVVDVAPIDSEVRPAVVKAEETTEPSTAKSNTLTKSRDIQPIATGTTPATTADDPPTSPKGDQGKISSWLKSKLSRHSSKPVKSSEPPKQPAASAPTTSTPDTVIIPAGPIEPESLPPSPPLPATHSVQPEPSTALTSHPPLSHSSSISSLSTDSPPHPRGRPRDSRTQPSTAALPSSSSTAPVALPASTALAPPTLRQESTAGSHEGSVEEFEEAKDHFDEETLPLSLPRPEFVAEARGGGVVGRGSPVRDSRFVENL